MARALLVALCVISTALANPSTAQADCVLNVYIDGWILDSSSYAPVADAEVCLGYNCVRTDAVGKFAIHDRTTVDDGQSFESRFCIDISSSGYPAKQYCFTRTKSPFPPCAGNDLTLTFDAGVLFLDSVSTGVSGLTMRPERHILWPNSPNPFNPSTEIRFTLAAPADVTLEIFDVLGRRVAMPVAGRLEAGLHETEWDARGAASGVYFYRLTTDDFTAVRKMLLLR